VSGRLYHGPVGGSTSETRSINICKTKQVKIAISTTEVKFKIKASCIYSLGGSASRISFAATERITRHKIARDGIKLNRYSHSIDGSIKPASCLSHKASFHFIYLFSA